MKELSEIAFFTDDVGKMTGFYRHLLGTSPAAQSEGIAIFMLGNTKLFIHSTYTPEKGELPPENHIAFTVEDVDKACTELKGKGLIIEVEPADYYWGRSAYLRDPDGTLIELNQPAEEE
jgi:catechol 2,3-dioxygenase-like lactoylglutathione lyase family enzyme